VHQQWFEHIPSQIQSRIFLFPLPVLSRKKRPKFFNLFLATPSVGGLFNLFLATPSVGGFFNLFLATPSVGGLFNLFLATPSVGG